MKSIVNYKIRFTVALLIIFSFSTSVFSNEYVVIINADNGYSSDTDEQVKVEVRQFFLKEKTNWPGGIKAKPFGPSSDTPAYTAFLSQVLNMDSAKLAQHWLRQKQMTGKTPPREIKSERLLVKMVAKDKGAVAIVSTKSELPETVKALLTF